jgi:hypothetical protein
VRCAILCVLVLAGCAGLSENECRSTDWAQLGERDGISGNRPRIEVYDYQCGRYHLHAAENDYGVPAIFSGGKYTNPDQANMYILPNWSQFTGALQAVALAAVALIATVVLQRMGYGAS